MCPGVGKTEWAHALAGGLSVWVVEGSNGVSHLCLKRWNDPTNSSQVKDNENDNI